MYPPTTTARTDTEIFDDLLAGVERSYDEVDAVFAANGLARSEIPRIDAKMRSDAASGMFMEVFANKLLPFDVFTAGAAVWHHFVSAKEKTPYRSYYPSTPTVLPRLPMFPLVCEFDPEKLMVGLNVCRR